jgi:outer membrane protein W
MILKMSRNPLPLVGLSLLGLALTALPALADPHYRRIYDRGERGDGEFRLHAGSFLPDGKSDYWRGIERDFGSDNKDFQDPSFGLDYFLPLHDNLSLQFSGTYYQGQTSSSYLGFLDNNNDRIRHDTTLDIGALTVGLVYHFTGRNAPIRPYIGGGGGVYSWRLTERGDFIDFDTTPNQVFTSRLRSDGATFGYYGLAGLEVPLNRGLSIYGEGRWTKADDTLDKDFEGFGKLDLSGREVALGLSWKL